MEKRLVLTNYRKQKGLTISALAKIVGVSRPAMSQIENAIYDPSWQVAKRLGDFFDEDPRVLLEVKEKN